MIEKNRGKFYNNLKVFSRGVIIHKQSKHKLFPLGNEHNHFVAGEEGKFCDFEIDGIKCAAINCFEVQFPKIWGFGERRRCDFCPCTMGQRAQRAF